jgi:hypothetical protein
LSFLLFFAIQELEAVQEILSLSFTQPWLPHGQLISIASVLLLLATDWHSATVLLDALASELAPLELF